MKVLSFVFLPKTGPLQSFLKKLSFPVTRRIAVMASPQHGPRVAFIITFDMLF